MSLIFLALVVAGFASMFILFDDHLEKYDWIAYLMIIVAFSASCFIVYILYTLVIALMILMN